MSDGFHAGSSRLGGNGPLVGLVLLAWLAVGQAAPVRAADPALTVTYAAISGSHAALWVTKEAGLFERHGLRVQLIYLGGGQATKVLLAGSSPIISISGPAPIAAAIQGADTVIVATVLNTFIFSIMARPELTRPEALRGRRVGISRFGAATDFALRYALRRWGLEPGRDVAILQVGGVPEILAALRQGAIDAGVLSSPSTRLARRAGFPELVDMGKLGIEYPGACIVTTRRGLRALRAARAPPDASRGEADPRGAGRPGAAGAGAASRGPH
ncbi:MAG: ABC transporter substrate-binding protein [Deltaproteobacteria bacterium]|nr:ABC transporter substrate-binding protein [Deltaproteobacteria bacterium]